MAKKTPQAGARFLGKYEASSPHTRPHPIKVAPINKSALPTLAQATADGLLDRTMIQRPPDAPKNYGAHPPKGYKIRSRRDRTHHPS